MTLPAVAKAGAEGVRAAEGVPGLGGGRGRGWGHRVGRGGHQVGRGGIRRRAGSKHAALRHCGYGRV
jgi:hypothetical protein